MSTGRGPVPALVEEATLQEWWVAGRWDCLCPIIDQVARRAVSRILAPDVDAINDAAQQTVYRCWKHGERPERIASFAYRIARNHALDVKKSAYASLRTRRPVKSQTLDGQMVEQDVYDIAVDTSLNALDALIVDETNLRLRAALRLVPDHLRRPLILHVFHRRTSAELAEQWQIKDGAMKMRLSRARTVLAAIFESPLPS